MLRRLHPSSLRFRMAVGVAVLVAGGAAVTATVDNRPARVRAAEWATSHAKSLPQTLDQFAAYPQTYRFAMLKVMSAETQSRLWRDQLNRFLASHPGINAEQRAFVDRAIEMTKPENFMPLAKPAPICEEVAKVFPNPEERRWFSKLGAPITPASSLEPTLIAFSERARSLIVAKAAEEDCNCNGFGLCECGLLESCRSNKACNEVEECGCIFVGTCTSVCRFIIESAPVQ